MRGGQSTGEFTCPRSSKSVYGGLICSATLAQSRKLTPDPLGDRRDSPLEDVRTEPRGDLIWVGVRLADECVMQGQRDARNALIQERADLWLTLRTP